VHYYVGGATKLYGAALYRLRPQDFAELAHADGVSPAWPLTYDDFEPWYTKAEWLYQVHGQHGEDPTEGPWSKQYPWPAVSHEPRIQEITDTLAAAGYHPFSAPCGILLDEADRPRSACIRCTWCDGYPCLVHAKSDAETIAVRPILDAPNVTLLVEAEVVRLATDATGHSVTEVVVSRGGATETYSADVVVVSAGAANSARVLLRSANDQHPNGLANGSDQVGRNYMFHNSKAVVALAKEPNDTVFQKTLALNDFYLAGDDRPHPLGNIQMVGKSNGWAMKGEKPKLTMFAPHWSLDDVARHAVDFWLTTEDLPNADNRVTVDDEGRVHLAYTSNNDSEAHGLYDELKKILNHIGMSEHHVLAKNFYMKMNIPIAGVAHQAGTCRFGTDPATSVLDVHCKAHELDNLYVVDTSFFPSIGAVNPALTAMANAIRVGEHLLERLG
jgi:choline dehydrogenase-like flavoprotein